MQRPEGHADDVPVIGLGFRRLDGGFGDRLRQAFDDFRLGVRREFRCEMCPASSPSFAAAGGSILLQA